MTDRPIIFSGPMVRALLEGRKTQTRRIAWIYKPIPGSDDLKRVPSPWQKCQPGDRLWVRENFAPHPQSADTVFYKATVDQEPGYPVWSGPWRPSIRMPRWASRLTLLVEAVKVERLQDISEEDAQAEGIWHQAEGFNIPPPHRPLDDGYDTARDCYADLWEAINGDGSWDANPWVVAVTFRVVKANIDNLEAA